MEIINFEFKKERRLGEFVQDFIGLLKIIFPHLIQTLLKLLVLPIAFMVIIAYYASTQINSNAEYSSAEMQRMFASFFLVAICLLVVCLIAFGFTLEYFMLLRDKRSLSFVSKDVIRAFRQHITQYFKFILVSILVSIIIFIPLSFAAFLTLLIPLIGSFAIGILFSGVMLWYFTAFLFYREGYFDLADTFISSFNVLRKKLVEYSVASFVVSFIFQTMISMILLIPLAVFFLLGYNFLGFSDGFFTTFWGRMLITAGGALLSILTICYYALVVICLGIIYESAKELHFGENIFSRINSLGRRKSD